MIEDVLKMTGEGDDRVKALADAVSAWLTRAEGQMQTMATRSVALALRVEQIELAIADHGAFRAEVGDELSSLKEALNQLDDKLSRIGVEAS